MDWNPNRYSKTLCNLHTQVRIYAIENGAIMNIITIINLSVIV